MTALDTIRSSYAAQPITLLSDLAVSASTARKEADGTQNPAVRIAMTARAVAAERAMMLLETGRFALFADDMSAGIITLNLACRLLGKPPHERTRLAVNQWEGMGK